MVFCCGPLCAPCLGCWFGYQTSAPKQRTELHLASIGRINSHGRTRVIYATVPSKSFCMRQSLSVDNPLCQKLLWSGLAFGDVMDFCPSPMRAPPESPEDLATYPFPLGRMGP